MKIQKAYISFFLLCFSLSSFGQSNPVDSLKHLFYGKGPTDKKTEIQIEIARSYINFNIDSAVTHAEDALHRARENGKTELELTAGIILVKSYIARGAFDKAMELTDQSLLLSEGNKWLQERAQLMALAGYILRRKGESDRSEDIYKECLALSKKANYEYGTALALKGLGDLAERKGEYSSSLEYYNSALSISEKLGDTELDAVIVNAIGIVYDYQGAFETALEYYLKALELCEQSGNLVKAAGICSNVASLQFALEKDSVALGYYKRSLDLARQSFSKTMEADALQGMFVVYKNLGDMENAARCAFEDLQLRKEMGDTRGLSYSYKNIGVYYQNIGDFKNAENSFTQGLEYAVQTDQKMKVAVLNLQLGRLMGQMNREREAIIYLNNALEISREINALREESLAYEDLAITSARMGAFDKAYEYQKLYNQAHKKLLSQNIHDQTVRMQAIYETRQRDERIKNLEIEARLKEELLLQSKRVRNLNLLGIGSLVMISFLFYSQSRLKQKSNLLLLTKNDKIQKQSEIISKSLAEKETLLKEIHHRVKNNLQIISSLFNLQSKKIRDKALLEIINEGKNRVEAMSLIHQNLYQNEGLTNIVMQKYLEQLMDHLSVSFKEAEKDIVYKVVADDIIFEIDTAIPVGLIVNELASNAYKHAFENKNKGLIEVILSRADDMRYILTVSDNGQGMDESLDLAKVNSLGLKLVHSLAQKQLRGEIHMSHRQGCRVDIYFAEINKKA